MPQVTLGKSATSFSDPVSKLTLAKGEVKDLPKGPHSWILKRAIRGGHVMIIKDAVIVAPPEPPKPPEPTRAEKLGELTRNELMAEFDFIDEDHVVEADKKKTKADCLEFLLSIEGEYAD